MGVGAAVASFLLRGLMFLVKFLEGGVDEALFVEKYRAVGVVVALDCGALWVDGMVAGAGVEGCLFGLWGSVFSSLGRRM